MTTSELVIAITESGFHAVSQGVTTRCELRMQISDADYRNAVVLLVPYQGLDEPGLVNWLIEMYMNELKIRRESKLKANKKKNHGRWTRSKRK